MDAKKINKQLLPHILPSFSQERHRIRVKWNDTDTDWQEYLAIHKLHIAFEGMFSRIKK